MTKLELMGFRHRVVKAKRYAEEVFTHFLFEENTDELRADMKVALEGMITPLFKEVVVRVEGSGNEMNGTILLRDTPEKFTELNISAVNTGVENAD